MSVQQRRQPSLWYAYEPFSRSALQIGGGEIFREEYDAGGETKDDHPAAGESGGGVLEIVAAAQSGMSTPRSLLGDWSRPLAEIRA